MLWVLKYVFQALILNTFETAGLSTAHFKQNHLHARTPHCSSPYCAASLCAAGMLSSCPHVEPHQLCLAMLWLCPLCWGCSGALGSRWGCSLHLYSFSLFIFWKLTNIFFCLSQMRSGTQSEHSASLCKNQKVFKKWPIAFS